MKDSAGESLPKNDDGHPSATFLENFLHQSIVFYRIPSMSYTHNGGADCSTCFLIMRRTSQLTVLFIVLTCLSVGIFGIPHIAQATSGKNGAKTEHTFSDKKAPAKRPAQKAVRTQPPRKRPLYVRSLMPKEAHQTLRERGISSGFGERAISRKKTRFHKGIDIPGPKDSKVIAYNDGEVIFTGVKNGYGNTVIIRQLDGREALYAHMNKYVVSVGETLKRGDHIGHVGKTGRATGYHLHFEIIDEGENLDPALHVWHASELVIKPNGLDPKETPNVRVAEPTRRTYKVR